MNFLQIPTYGNAVLCLPAEYIAAKMMVVRALVGKLDLYCIKPDAKPLAKINTTIDFAALVPKQLFHSLENTKNIKCLLIGGARLDNSIEKKLQKSPNRVFETFGMAETLSHIALREITAPNNPCFRLLPSIKINQTKDKRLKIISPKRGLNNYFTSNDLVKINKDNSFTWLGRADNLIQTGSLKISPEKLEKKMQQCLAVLQGITFFLGSEKDAKLGFKLIMLIEGRESKNLVAKLKIEMKEKLKFFEIPKKFTFRKKFIRSENFKILRKQTLVVEK